MVISVAFRIDLTTGNPMVIFGTKCPSITSTCRIFAPPFFTEAISSPSLVKSAESSDGAISNILVILLQKTDLALQRIMAAWAVLDEAHPTVLSEQVRELSPA